MNDACREECALFFAKFSIMLSSGVPLLDALGHLADEATTAGFVEACTAMEAAVRGGDSLADALARSPDLFDDTVVTLVRAGETTGTLDLTTSILPQAILFARLDRWKGMAET